MKTVSCGMLALAAVLGVSSSLFAQTDSAPTAPAPTPTPTDAAPGDAAGPRGNRGNRPNFNPEEMRTRMLASMREQLGVTKDDEWTLISERLTTVMEARRGGGPGGSFMAFGRGQGGPGGPGGQGGPGGPDNQGRRRPPMPPELDALQEAIKNNAPDAEIQARLAKVREVRRENEAKVTKAQEDLRAVLNVRQEAVLVSAGMLP